MSLIYRAIWQDHAEGIHDRALKAFDWWIGLRNPGDRSYTPDREEDVGGATTLIQRGAGDAGSIQRCAVHVDGNGVRLTTTLITTTTRSGIGSVWVDQERVSRDAFAPFQVHAPELSTRLIAKGRDPRRGPVPLDVKPRAMKPGEVPGLVSLLCEPRRDLPMVVYAATPDLDPRDVLTAGIHAARVLAGSAAVYLISAAARSRLLELLGEDLAVAPGAVRVYLPGVKHDEPDPSRHRSLESERVRRDPEAIPHTIIQLLAPAIAARRAPHEYAHLRDLLRTIHPGDDETQTLRSHLDDLSTRVREGQARIDDLEMQLATAENRILDLVDELGDAQAQVNEHAERLVQILLSTTTPPPEATEHYAATIRCCSDAARLARRHLPGVVLPDAACRDLDELDRALEARSWGQTAWRAFLALHAFALDRSFKPGFWEWCVAARSPLVWPASPKKLAMRESESVMEIEDLREKRRFPVDDDVAAEGTMIMQAHIKVAEGGGPQIPRIYFHDDRHGATGKVHVGFFGPHRHVPTAGY